MSDTKLIFDGTSVELCKVLEKQRDEAQAQLTAYKDRVDGALRAAEAGMAEVVEDELYTLCTSADREEVAEIGYKAAIARVKQELLEAD